MTALSDLQQAYLFQGLPAPDLQRFAAAARLVRYEPGEYIYKRGDRKQFFCVIAAGRVELVIQEQHGISCISGQVGAGGHFGEVSLITGKPRSLSARAISKVRMLVFDKEPFEKVLMANPMFHRALDRTLAERLVLASQGGHDFCAAAEPISGPAPSYLSSMPPVGEGKTREGAAERRVDYDFRGGIDLARKIRERIEHFAGIPDPVLITGEPGTGRRLVAKQIHLHSERSAEPYVELDLREFSSWIWEGKLFGYERDAFPYSSGRQLGLFEQLHRGTVVLYHAESLATGLQQKLFDAVRLGKFATIDGSAEQPFRIRLILISSCSPATLEEDGVLIEELLDLFADRIFALPPLREHKRDILPLVEYYLKQYNVEYGKEVTAISHDALGLLMSYEWPGNLTELSSVIQRAVMLARQDEIQSEQIILGLPRSEGKLVYNLLRIPWVRGVIEHRLYPVLPRIVVSVLFCIGILILFFGPQEPEHNLGLTLSWYIGWPLLIISFFFLPRFWCSVCALSAPGKVLQEIIQPTRRLPALIASYSGWIMALLCLTIFWVEIVWNAYERPWLTAAILLSITMGSLLFSVLYQRYTWCRYLCPLGALNAIFSMPSIVELRANRQLCENYCTDHACYRGDGAPGCPMFRHPFLVDNNKDCILCGRCIKNCRLNSTQLNLRLAPQELWSIQTPRPADSFLVAALGIVFFLLARHREFQAFLHSRPIPMPLGEAAAEAMSGSLVFWGMVAAAWFAYSLLCRLQASRIAVDYRAVRASWGYGLIPLVLGGYLAFYAEMFMQGAWRLVPNFLLLFGSETGPEEFTTLSSGGVQTLLHIIILGGGAASLFATYKIFERLLAAKPSLRQLTVPFLFIAAGAAAYLVII